MDAKHLGDSYDLVKRFFATALKSIAQLYAHSRFIPTDIRTTYTAVTSIAVLGERPVGVFGLFLDPDTGIHLPDGANQKTSKSHVSLAFIAEVFSEFSPSYVICYDQGFDRICGTTPSHQRDTKRQYLAREGLHSFYYVSHSPLLFVTDGMEKLIHLADVILENGLPSNKLEPNPGTGA